jgi:hypothetical protein
MPRRGGKFHNFDSDPRLTEPTVFQLGGEKHTVADLSDDLLKLVDELANSEEDGPKLGHNLSRAVALFVVDPQMSEEEYNKEYDRKVALFDNVAIKYKQAALSWIQKYLEDPLGEKRQDSERK